VTYVSHGLIVQSIGTARFGTGNLPLLLQMLPSSHSLRSLFFEERA